MPHWDCRNVAAGTLRVLFPERSGFMKRFTLVALVAVAMVVCSLAAAHAKGYTVTTKTIELKPAAGGTCPGGSGTLYVIIAGPIAVYRGAYPSYHYEADFDVQVWGLAPNRQYGVYLPSKTGYQPCVAVCTTDADGNGSGSSAYPLWVSGPHDFPNKITVVDLRTGVVELSN
jgi:hypothetical protein